MNQVGDQFEFVVLTSAGTEAGSEIYSHVWRFWDGTSTATSSGTVVKTANIGGQPGTDLLQYNCTPVAIDGQAQTFYGSITVNNPPVIVPAPNISLNDAYVPYQTQLSLYAFDFENNVPLSFVWVDEAAQTVLSSTGTSTGTIIVSGTWTGNGTTIINNYPAYGNAFNTTVITGETIRCYVMDTRSGTSFIDFDLRGYLSPAPASGIAAQANFSYTDSSSIPIARIGAGQSFDFEVNASSLTNAPLTFQWSFAGSNNWTVASYGSGTTTVQPGGVYQSLYEKDLSQEVVTSGTSKVAAAVCVVTNGQSSSAVDISVVLLANVPPTDVTFVVRDNITQDVFPDLSAIPSGSVIQLEAHAVDTDNDLVAFEWFLALTGSDEEIGTAFPLTYDVKGGMVVVDTSGGTTGLQITGNVVATDRVGGMDTVVFPTITLT